jgi:hypothetical protein
MNRIIRDSITILFLLSVALSQRSYGQTDQQAGENDGKLTSCINTCQSQQKMCGGVSVFTGFLSALSGNTAGANSAQRSASDCNIAASNCSADCEDQYGSAAMAAQYASSTQSSQTNEAMEDQQAANTAAFQATLEDKRRELLASPAATQKNSPAPAPQFTAGTSSAYNGLAVASDHDGSSQAIPTPPAFSTATTGGGATSCAHENSSVSAKTQWLTGAGHCDNENAISLTNNSGQKLWCSYAWVSSSSIVYAQGGTYIAAGQTQGGEIGGMYSCGVPPNGTVLFDCVSAADNSNSCSAASFTAGQPAP